MPQTYKFSTEHGRTLCRTILRECMPHDTHDFQLEVRSHLLDNDDTKERLSPFYYGLLMGD
ncbi:ATPase [Rhizopogon vesiculosus]|uniref:ATPase n=1 Tax=Rhizopogon vesiculosus TaxID=180088 RepID=A0A1J8R6K9_9AGAM|nr:ATPase [Rhizopogon vesiculosus]